MTLKFLFLLFLSYYKEEENNKKSNTMNQVSIIGAGTMGNGIAQSFALNGFQVFLIDIQEENLSKAEKTISENLERMIKKEIINQNHKENTLSKIRFQTSMNEDVKNSDLVIEAVTESESIKLEILIFL